MNQDKLFLSKLYREFLLSDLLGLEKKEILYWLGKEITREYKLSTIDALKDFFDKANFGNLEVINQKKGSYQFALTGDIIEERLLSENCEFKLESGVIAEAIQNLEGHISEAEDAIDVKKQTVTINVQVDLAD